MADLATLLKKAEDDLADQSKALQVATEDAKVAKQEWREASGKQVAASKVAWQDAVKEKEAVREYRRAVEARLQKLIDKLPLAGQQAPSTRALLVCQNFSPFFMLRERMSSVIKQIAKRVSKDRH